MPSYLENLTIRLATGLGRLPASQRDRHAEFFRGLQRDDGGWAGREGESDLYYTSFALRGLALLGELDGEPAQRAHAFLQSQLTGQAQIIDFLSLIYGASLLELSAGLDVFESAPAGWRAGIAEALEAFRRDDGGYAKGLEGQASSTYHSFLVVLCHQLIEVETPDPAGLARFVMSQHRDDGGFVEIRPMRRSGTNPTAAAIGLLRILDHVGDEVRTSTGEFLLDMQTDEGGLRANTRIPIADLLSTFTGMLTLADLGRLTELELPAVRDFVLSLEQPSGGFFGAEWDEACDVEYSFYGLGSLGLLAEAKEG
jgi:geranylgeranyl transferase type-2 subunit beta